MKSLGPPREISRYASPIIERGIIGANQILESLNTVEVMSSVTLQLFNTDRRLLSEVLMSFDSSLAHTRQRMLDAGCGYGALSQIVGHALGYEEIAGIDIDEERISAARVRGINVARCALYADRFPFPDDHFDFVTTFGGLDHLRSFDNIVCEVKRVLKPGGCLAVSTTNLASWVNRIALFLGYQPRNLEISKKGLYGVHRAYKEMYSCVDVMKRYTSPTLRGMEEFLASNGFVTLRRWGSRLIPLPDDGFGRGIRVLDRILSHWPSLAVRFMVLCRKSTN